MKNQLFAPFRQLTAFLLLLSLFTVACGSDKGKVEGVNKLYGTDHKLWKTHKETSTTGEKVKQTDTEENQELHVFANGNYTMTDGKGGSVSGKYEFDQAGNKISFTPEGKPTKVFNVETLTDDKLTITADGASLMLEAE